MKGYKSFGFLIVVFFIFVFILIYLFLRSYTYHDTKNSTFGTIGFISITYFDNKNVRLYPISKSDAEWLYINNSNIENFQVLKIFIPLERLELAIRGTKVVKLSDEEINKVRQRKSEAPTKIKDLPY